MPSRSSMPLRFLLPNKDMPVAADCRGVPLVLHSAVEVLYAGNQSESERRP